MTVPNHTPNPHVTDPILQCFLTPAFSSTDYLNATLPTLKPQSQSLSSTASQTQSLISTLSAQITRLSTTLTTLTDDILRTSSRLAYEVELLRGEALTLADSLSGRGDLHEHIVQFVPEGLEKSALEARSQPSSPTEARHTPNGQALQVEGSENGREPDALKRLRTLQHVRRQLQTVIGRFNLALSFPMPPSLLATATMSLISVNVPNQDPELESKGQAALAKLKSEISVILERGEYESARNMVAELRDVCVIWKGTGEEKARERWVDGLAEMVDAEVRRAEEAKKGAIGGEARIQGRRDVSAIRGVADDVSRTGTPTGFLRRLREEIYME
ncbi:hypothetical protein MMC21_003208 [Puttea exsequens]|nr:hypothetical protein [Puttea exsequens]